MAEAGVYERNYVIAASFEQRADAKEAAENLKHNGFPNVWLGTVSGLSEDGQAGFPSGEAAVIREIELTPVDWTQRVFGEGNLTLHDIVVDRSAFANKQEEKTTLHDGEIILTVDVPENMQSAMDILAASGGHLLAHDATPGSYAAQEATVLDRERRRTESKILNARVTTRLAEADENVNRAAAT